MALAIPRPAGPVTGGETFVASGRRRLHAGASRGSIMRIDERGVTREAEGDEPITIVWERCEAAIRLPSGGLVLNQRDGAWLKVSIPGWDSDPLPRIEALLPPGRIVPACDREQAEAIERIVRERFEPIEDSRPASSTSCPKCSRAASGRSTSRSPTAA